MTIGNFSFQDCHSLTSITIPNCVTSIGVCAFQNCTSLTTIYIGNSIKTIDNAAFSNCPEITDVFCFAKNVPETNNNVFLNSYTDYATLHVPQGSINHYKESEPWKNFKNIVKIDMPEHSLIYIIDNEVH